MAYYSLNFDDKKIRIELDGRRDSQIYYYKIEIDKINEKDYADNFLLINYLDQYIRDEVKKHLKETYMSIQND